MAKFSLNKMNEIKRTQCITLKEISQKTNIPHSTIAKVFSGFNSNPSIDTVIKIAEVLECGVDDFIEYDSTPKSKYYIDRQVEKYAQYMMEQPELNVLFELCTHLDKEDIQAIIGVIKRFHC